MTRQRKYPRPMQCPRCKGWFDQTSGRHRYCSVLCSATVACKSAEQLHNHEGPVFEKWRDAIKAAVEKL